MAINTGTIAPIKTSGVTPQERADAFYKAFRDLRDKISSGWNKAKTSTQNKPATSMLPTVTPFQLPGSLTGFFNQNLYPQTKTPTNQPQQAAAALLQKPEYQGVLTQPDTSPVKKSFMQELARDTQTTTPPGVADTIAGTPPVTPPTQEQTLTAGVESAQKAYEGYQTEAPTFLTKFKSGMAGKGYDLDAGKVQIESKRAELMRAMSEGTFETRDYSKVGRIAAEMADMVAEQQKKVSTVQTETENALSFFEQSGVMKQKDLENARSSLQSYFTAQDAALKNEIDIAKLVGFFRGSPTVEMIKAGQSGVGSAVGEEDTNFLAQQYLMYQNGELKTNPLSGLKVGQKTSVMQLANGLQSDWSGDLTNAKAALQQIKSQSPDNYDAARADFVTQLSAKYGDVYGNMETKLPASSSLVGSTGKYKYGLGWIFGKPGKG